MTPAVPRPAGLMRPDELRPRPSRSGARTGARPSSGWSLVSAITLDHLGGHHARRVPLAGVRDRSRRTLNLLRMQFTREQRIADNVRYLEKKQAKELRRRGELPPA